MHRRTLIAAMSLWLAAVMPLAAAEKSGFEGKWRLDKGQSTGAEAGPDDLTQEIRQKGDNLVIRSTWREPKSGVITLPFLGVASTEMKLGMGGSEMQNTVGPYQFNTKTTMSGSELVTEWSAAMEKGALQGKWTRTLSPDGKTMTLKIDSGAPASGEHNTATLVFVKR